MNRTIVAVATPAAPAGLGVVRISGPQAITVAARVFRPADASRPPEAMAGYTAAYGHVADKDGDIDDCVALVFRKPHSYTGEDVVELSCHGGVYLLRRVVAACLQAGAQPAGPGEFTRQAFLNGKMDLSSAESVMDLIAAKGRLAARSALAAREGNLYRRLQEVKASLLEVTAQFGAYVDYPDEDIPTLQNDVLQRTITHARQALSALLRTYDTGRILREGVDTAIVGSPNVGKSTLMNCLAGCERSIVTDIAGTTRDVIEETVQLGDVLMRLADTAGIRETGDTVESVGVEKARQRLQQAALVLAVFDGSRPLSDDDRALAEQLADTAAVAVINKADRPGRIEKEWLSQRFSHVVFLSAKEKTGLDDLAAAVTQLVGMEQLNAAEPILANERQRQCTARCLACLEEADCALKDGFTLDAVCVSLTGAVECILDLTGERAAEAVVEEVFSRFCVGK